MILPNEGGQGCQPASSLPPDGPPPPPLDVCKNGIRAGIYHIIPCLLTISDLKTLLLNLPYPPPTSSFNLFDPPAV